MTVTYYSSTIGATGSTQINTPSLLYSVVGGKITYPGDLTTSAKGGKVWFYTSTNVPADLFSGSAPPFTDGALLGMSPGDILFGVMNGGANSTDSYPYIGVLGSTQTSLTTAPYGITSNYTT